MTNEQLEKAKELANLIKIQKEQLEKRLPRQRQSREIQLYSESNYLNVPNTIRDTILLLIENELKKDIEKLEEEFKEL